ncbi:MAG: P-loop NTPase [Planctomycetota bacterium]|nr:P-loop NTPase [Planctomycetota bacterium]
MTLDPRADGAAARLADVKRVIAVTGGKGGIGKSSVASVLALEAAGIGHRVGLLDLDLTSPSTHVLLGYPTAFPEEPFGVEPCDHAGVRCMSIAHFAGAHAAPLRGASVSSALLEILAITNWGPLDVLVVDMPPGLGDAALDVLKLIERAEHLVVTTSSRVVLDSVNRMLQLLMRVRARVLGVIENMQRAPSSAASELAGRHGVRCLGALPYDASFEDAAGDPERISGTSFASSLRALLPALNL